MLALHIYANAEEMAAQFKSVTEVIEAKKDISVGLLRKGMQSGRPSVSFMFELPDGKIVFAETSLQLFLAAANAFAAMQDIPVGSYPPTV